MSRVLVIAVPLVLSLTWPACTVDVVKPKARDAVTRTDIAVIAESLKQFRLDTGAYPKTGGEFLPIADVLEDTLVRQGYLRMIVRDGWGNTIRIWSDGSHFVLVSPGQNARYDIEYLEQVKMSGVSSIESYCKLALSSASDDVVAVNDEPCFEVKH